MINKNITVLLDSINRSSDIDPYVYLLGEFRKGSIENNAEYQNTYRKYWRLNAARLSGDYCKHYFQVMERYREKNQRNIEDIVKELYEIPSNSKGKKTVQFSFATKLLHTINNALPLYDSMVGDFYFFPQIKPSWGYDKKLLVYLRVYNYLQREYERVIENGLLSESIIQFRNHFELSENYTDQKIIDTLLWKFVTHLRSGAVGNGEIRYS